MKIKIGVVKRDGFKDQYGIQFQSGLMLLTESTVFLSAQQKQTINQQFQEIVDQLRLLGIEIEEHM
jgi:hypothetical protein